MKSWRRHFFHHATETAGPPRPEGVSIVHHDGREEPIELAYVGFENGYWVWTYSGAVVLGDRLRIEKMPARTAIQGVARAS